MARGPRGTFSSPAARILSGLLSLQLPFAFLLMAIPDPEGPTMPAWVSPAGWVLTGLTVLVSLRLFAMRVVVRDTGDAVVHGAFRTVRVPAGEVVGLELPDREPTAMFPRLVLRDGRRLRLTALARVKNRAWGPERSTRRRAQALADHLGVPVGQDADAAAHHRSRTAT